MKILRAIGAFFAKIGRWIANTAWVQPLLIVGGIFGIIFSIPYIKKGIEGLQSDTTDYKYRYYQNNALNLKEGGTADELLGYLEEGGNADKIRSKFGSKFFLVFAEKSCSACKEGVEGYKYFASHNSSAKFKMYSILVDKTDSDGEYMATPIVEKHIDLLYEIAAVFGNEGYDEYPLYRNLINKGESTKVKGYVDKIDTLPQCTDKAGDGIDTPLTLMIDLDTDAYGYHGITQLFYNYVDFDESGTNNASTKSDVIRDIWNYQGLFDPDYQA